MLYPALNLKIRNIVNTVYNHLGPDLPDEVYKEGFIHELQSSGIFYVEDPVIPIDYKGRLLESGLTACFIIESEIVIYIKNSARSNEYNKTRIYKFMDYSGMRCGMILDFNSSYLSGIMRVFVTIEEEF